MVYLRASKHTRISLVHRIDRRVDNRYVAAGCESFHVEFGNGTANSDWVPSRAAQAHRPEAIDHGNL